MNTHSQKEYESEVIETVTELFVRAMSQSRPIPALSDEDKGNEWKAQRMFFEALGEFRSKVQDAQALTDLRKDALGDLLNALSDETPDAIAWSEAISCGGIK